MKTIRNLLFLVALAPVFFISCNDDKDDNTYGISVGMVENPDGKNQFFIDTDKGNRLFVKESRVPYTPKDSQRVVTRFVILSEKEAGSGYNYDVALFDYYNILTKNIFNITSATQDSIGNDPISISDVWVSNDYLNVEFNYLGYSRSHFINLVSDSEKTYDDGKVHLEFRHNANGDMANRWFWGIASFNLKTLQEEGKTSLDLVIHNQNYDGVRTYERKYTFGEALEQTSLEIDQDQGIIE
ncbi:MAG: NigD-like protein [Bacteroidales bacterium]|jgi:hypothetical protein|nr:NigD-like protein [Bacteroidales bacterium]